MDLPLGVVLGTFGVERHLVTFRGQAAHAGSTPMDKRRDALAAAALLALEIYEIASKEGGVCTMGSVVTKPGIVTSVVETAECLLDQRHLEADKLASMLDAAQDAGAEFAHGRNVDVDWERIWQIEPILFDEQLIELADEAIKEVAGTSHLPSGPLHDAAVSRAGIPTVMLFVQSLRGLSHTKLEDTKEEHIELSVRALDGLADARSPSSPKQARRVARGSAAKAISTRSRSTSPTATLTSATLNASPSTTIGFGTPGQSTRTGRCRPLRRPEPPRRRRPKVSGGARLQPPRRDTRGRSPLRRAQTARE